MHKALFNLFDRFVGIITDSIQIKYVKFDFEKYDFDNSDILDFLNCYEMFYKIKNQS